VQAAEAEHERVVGELEGAIKGNEAKVQWAEGVEHELAQWENQVQRLQSDNNGLHGELSEAKSEVSHTLGPL
jgi:hypothetical protein